MTNQMNVTDRTGHLTVKWDPVDDDEVEAARAVFNSMREKGYRAFRVKRFGRPGERLDEFDPGVEQMTMVPHLAGG